MRTKLTKLLMVILIIAATTGTAVASGGGGGVSEKENLTATWDSTNTQIDVAAWNFKHKSDGTTFWYQIRYYPPGQYVVDREEGYIIQNPPFVGLTTYSLLSPYTEAYTNPPISGEWRVALMKGGNSRRSAPDEVESFRIVRPVIVPPSGTKSILLIKTANPTEYFDNDAGLIVTYTYKIVNTGTETLSGPFTVVDDKLGTIPCGTGPLFAGAHIKCETTYTIQGSDVAMSIESIINHATASSTNDGVESNAEFTIYHLLGNRPIPPPPGIPEFPTIALPVAAVLGILFIMQRRKKEE